MKNLIINPAHNIGVAVSTISNALVEEYKSNRILNNADPIELNIIIERGQAGKFKPEDPETNLERIEFIINQFDQRCIRFNYHITLVDHIPYTPHEIYTSILPFKRRWIGGDKVMVKKDSGGYDAFGVRHLGVSDAIKDKFEPSNVIEFSYEDKFDDIITNMCNCKCVYSEYSSFAVLATYVGCPLYIVTKQAMIMDVDSSFTNRPITLGNSNLTLQKNIGTFDHEFVQRSVDNVYSLGLDDI